ncbi:MULTISPECIES: HEPN domain-containing protein [Paenibacillus]|uniref:Uncharacterized protein n=1 Tax=Paenibacillus lautus TaxID=1401 RepID=A0A385U006_PAELA|nr:MULTISPECIES: HEPN domain-containing protein [Paenibacillus]AWP25281.1 hypothetical protein B9D94_00960 [Paenibacillus sp. Cedars]AYB48007.1 hypothetical protein D5F53_32275 [Paenibacillus lautus]VTR54833.1 Uncharacterised protein [Actinobacillus pleuropneumoniae]
MAKKVKIYDSVEYRGNWWLPGEEDKKVHGVLVCSIEKQIRLEVSGELPSNSSLMNSDHPSEIPIVLGDCYDGFVTLLCCLGSSPGMQVDNNQGTSRMRVTMVFENVIFGEHYESVDDIFFPQFIAEFSNLKYWMDQPPVTVDIFEKLTIEEHSIRELDVRIEKLSLRIKSGLFYQDVSDQYEYVGIRYTYYLSFEPDEPQPLAWYLNVVDKFRHFLSIYTDSLNYVLALEGINEDRAISICSIPSPDYKEVTIRRWEDFIISIYNMSENISDILNNWYALEQEDIIYTYIGNIPSDRKTIQEKFLGYARIIESLHRLQDNGVKTTFIDPDDYLRIIEKVMSSFKEEVPTDLWNKLRDNLKFANEFGFQRRIKEVLKELPDEIKESVSYGIKPSKYADIVRNNRDYYTHFHSKPNNILNDYQMLAMNFSLKVICMWMISRKIGISEEDLSHALLHRGRWLSILDSYKDKIANSIQ